MVWRLLTKVYIETLLKWGTGNPKMRFAEASQEVSKTEQDKYRFLTLSITTKGLW